VPNVTLDELGVHLSKWPASGEDLVFTGERGGPIRHSEMTKAWAAARDCAGVPDWARLHDLRHYCASLLIAGGGGLGEGCPGQARAFLGQDHPRHLRPSLAR
jgi:integrase